MIIDTSTYVGHWPFRKVDGATLEALAENGAKNGITHMVVSSVNALFYHDAMEGNLELLEELKSYNGPVKFLPFAVVNPLYPAWEEDMIKCIKELGFCGIELAPAYHRYALGNEGAAAFRLAGELGVPVRIEAEFENLRQQHHLDVNKSATGDDIAALLSASDKTTLIIGGYFPYVLGDNLREIVKARKNVFFNMRRPDATIYDQWIKAREYAGSEHFCFGTLAPFLYVEPALVRVQFSDEDEKSKIGILSENIRPYLGL